MFSSSKLDAANSNALNISGEALYVHTKASVEYQLDINLSLDFLYINGAVERKY